MKRLYLGVALHDAEDSPIQFPRHCEFRAGLRLTLTDELRSAGVPPAGARDARGTFRSPETRPFGLASIKPRPPEMAAWRPLDGFVARALAMTADDLGAIPS